MGGWPGWWHGERRWKVRKRKKKIGRRRRRRRRGGGGDGQLGLPEVVWLLSGGGGDSAKSTVGLGCRRVKKKRERGRERKIEIKREIVERGGEGERRVGSLA